MEYWNDEMAKRIEQRQVPSEEDLQFHQCLFKATGNETYYQFSEVLTDFFITIREVHFGNVDDTKLSLVEHRNIVKKIKLKDTDGAKREMEHHLRPLRKYIE
jgi:DNA-binding FadR family transcriptional regulator